MTGGCGCCAMSSVPDRVTMIHVATPTPLPPALALRCNAGMESISLSDLTARRIDHRARIAHVRWLGTVATATGVDEATRRFAQRWPEHQPDLATKAAVPPTHALPFALDRTPAALVSAFGAGVRGASVMERAGLQRVPFLTPVPQFDVSAIAETATFIGENSPKPVLALATPHTEIPPGKVAALVIVSREFLKLMPPGSESVVDAALTSAIVLASDRLALDPTLAADPLTGRPASLTFGAAITVTATSPAEASSALGTLIAQYFAAVTPTRPVIVLGPAMVAWLSASGLHPMLTLAGGFVGGLPAVVSAAAGSTLAIFDAPRTLYADDGASVDVSQYATIQMADTPDAPSAAGTVLTDMWQTNRACFRVERFCSWQGSPASTGVLTVTVP